MIAKVRSIAMILTAGLLVSACQTSGSEGLLGSVLPKSGTTESQQQASVSRGTNPNDGRRLINTRNELTDYCPAVRIRSGTETYREFPKGANKDDIDNVRYQAAFTQVARECNYVGQALQIKVGARGRVIAGPKGGPGSIEMPIRVAVTVGGETVYSKLHRPVQTIPQGTSGTQFAFIDDQVSITAPSAKNVRIFVGFDEGPVKTQ